MIVVTGAAGFIGSKLAEHLNSIGFSNLLLVDSFENTLKQRNFTSLNFEKKLDREEFLAWFSIHSEEVDFVYHLGARTDTTEKDLTILDKLNLNYSKEIWKICSKQAIPLVYASSAATYGDGANGYSDNHENISRLAPLNLYGESKQAFDEWVLKQPLKPPFWAGLKFFNVYGPNEYHKGRMASVVYHTFQQVQKTGKMQLFRSHRKEYKDGEQLRDFIYVKDVVSVCSFFLQNRSVSAIFNLGTGHARSFKDLAKATFMSMGMKPNIEYIDTPLDIREKYQYFTEADMSKLLNAGYTKNFYSLEEGVGDYVENYLLKQK